MAKTTQSYFETLIDTIQNALDEIKFQRLDISPDRVVFEIHGRFGHYEIRIKEILSNKWRTYSFYVLSEGDVVVGFDNYPDRRALREKYGSTFSDHLFERIPHKHGPRKTTMELTDDWNVNRFLEYLRNELSK